MKIRRTVIVALAVAVAGLTGLAGTSSVRAAGPNSPVRPHVHRVAPGSPGANVGGKSSTRAGAGGNVGGTPPLIYHRGPVQHNPVIYIVLWGARDNPGATPVQNFVASVGGTTYADVLTQYYDSTGHMTNGMRLGGVWRDPNGPSGCVGVTETYNEAARAQSVNGWATGGDVQYIVMPQPGSCVPGMGTQWCAWHSWVNYAFSLLPYSGDYPAGCAGNYSVSQVMGSTASHEIFESATDPQAYNGWLTSDGWEIGDLCDWQNVPGPGGYVQQQWSNSMNTCVSSSFQAAMEANTTALWSAGTASSVTNTGIAIMAGTTPSITALPGGGHEVAFQGNTGNLQTWGTADVGSWGLGMMPGSSPSIAALAGGGYEIAYQDYMGSLWTVGEDGSRHNWVLGMYRGSSPSITALSNGGYEVAFEANTTSLWTAGTAGVRDWGLGMYRGSSPSIAALTNGGYEAAFEANTTSLWTVGSTGVANWALGMMAGTNPSIAGLPSGGYQIAFQANGGALWTLGTGTLGSNLPPQGMMAGTSPSIITLPGGGFEVAFQANTGSLVTVGTGCDKDWGLGMRAGTSPSISA